MITDRTKYNEFQVAMNNLLSDIVFVYKQKYLNVTRNVTNQYLTLFLLSV